MLTIQPNFTRNTAFRGEKAFVDQETYEAKKKYYKDKQREFNEILDDENIPEGMKKGAKVCKVASEGILEGWAVAWGASKGASMLKSPKVMKFFTKIGKLAKPLAEGLGKVFNKIGKFASEQVDILSKSKFVEKMNANKVGHVIVEGVKKLSNGVKYICNTTKDLFLKYTGKLTGDTYDKVTGAASKTLGVGAGIGGAYTAARGCSKPEGSADVDDYENEADFLNDQYDDEEV